MFTAETKKATITNAVGNGTQITYTASNTFEVGDIVHISGIEPYNLNIPDAVIATRTNSQFTVLSTEEGTSTNGGVAVFDALKDHLMSTSVINTQTKVIGEWNLNAANNIATIGNYRYENTGNPAAMYSGYEATLEAGTNTVTLTASPVEEVSIVSIDRGVPSAGFLKFTASNSFIAGDKVIVKNVDPDSYNDMYTITEATEDYFIVSNGNPNTVVSTYGATAMGLPTKYLLVGQKFSPTSGDGAFGSSLTHITQISEDGVTFTVSDSHGTDGAIVFDVDKVPSVFVEENANTLQPGYYGGTDSDVVVDGGLDDEDKPYVFSTTNEKQKMIYSLEDCFGKFRPRSGINKTLYLPNGRRFGYSSSDMATRPRYYASSRYDKFKYWSSFRNLSSKNTYDGRSPSRLYHTGISYLTYNNELETSENLISNTAPFVVYRDQIAANRIIVKMQTHVGSSDSEGSVRKEVPSRWSVEKMNTDSEWVSLVEINNNVSGISDPNYFDVPNDGYVEFQYGLDIPEEYKDVFYHAGEYANATNLPVTSFHGYAYLVGASKTTPGNYYIWDQPTQQYVTPYEVASYSWKIGSESVGRTTPLVTNTTSPEYFQENEYTDPVYREIDFLKGLRLVIHSMKTGTFQTFDLIELSPRLAVDLSDKTTEFSITKVASDLGNSGMPVGQLLSSTGKMSIFDYDQAFNMYNTFDHNTKTGSILGGLVNRNLQVKFYEITKNVGIYDYYMPIKTMYAEGFAQFSSMDRMVNIDLKDQFIQFESMTAPELFIPQASLSFAISTLLDSIGFSNYAFKRVSSSDPTIPFFYVQPDTSIAEVLNSLAVSTQHTMFFDEYNNFIVMSNDYMLPSPEDRDVDAVLYGSKDYLTGDQNVKNPNQKLSNILEIKTEMDDIYNDGKIVYKARSIQKDMKQLKQAYAVDEGRTWVYKPVLLWEAQDEESPKSINEQNSRTAGYVLTAVPLNSNLSDALPVFDTITHKVINNIIDLGQGAYWMPRYNGYFYANGEIIRYDAVEYSVEVVYTNGSVGVKNVWIKDVLEYRNYFSQLKFSKKMYPSGRVRIYSKLDADLNVVAHGRGQFGTDITTHYGEMNPYWSDTTNRTGVIMKSDYLFGRTSDGNRIPVPANTVVGTVGKLGNTLAKKSTSVTNKIKNVLITIIPDEKDYTKTKVTTNTSQTNGNVRASALVLQGPSGAKIKAASPKTYPYTPRDFISYVHKPLDTKNRYVHFGTRMRIIGKTDDSQPRDAQIIYGNTPFYTNGKASINGGSGGIAIMVNPATNTGYYFEISALSLTGLQDNAEDLPIDNVFFYKLHKDPSDNHANPHAIPVPLFTSNMGILVDDGEFVGQNKTMAEKYPTVYDLAVEYVQVSKTWLRFYLYINGQLIAAVDDDGTQGPILPIKNNMALFNRGSSKVMFENVYALGNRYSFNPEKTFNTGSDISPIFNVSAEKTNTSTAKYALSGIIQESFLGSVNPASGPSTAIYYDEFGTIMREAAYMNVKFDKAYPALMAKLVPTINTNKGYVVSGFSANAYGAEFMLFNATDTLLNLDSSTGNYLRIQGVAFNQESNNTLTVDAYYNKISDFSNPDFKNNNLTTTDALAKYTDIKNSRTTYGLKSFSLEAEYLQTQDDARKMMEWLMAKISKPRRAIGVSTFGTPYVQLGDILKVDYVDENNIGQSSSKDARYVVYSIEYRYNTSGPQSVIYLSEVS